MCVCVCACAYSFAFAPGFSVRLTHMHSSFMHSKPATRIKQKERERKKGDRGGCISFDLLWVN